MDKNKTVVILGSGLSINNLTEEQKQHINQCEVRIAINKFAAFYKIAGIVPTHVYFLDSFSKASINFLRYIFDVIRKDKLKNITFLLSTTT
ncbi:MAG TPA: hypothetical protein VKZ95_08325, partial [Sphingobacteriaceae bacterium]|nr:hypothetical protein [Sphingobacteriaceae bacterium]